MKKNLITFAILMCFISCTSTKEIMNSWLGHTKHELIMKFGPPARIADDGNEGEILVYAKEIYIKPRKSTFYAGGTSTTSYKPGKKYWDYKMFYVNKKGIIYHWLLQRQQIPPQQIDLNIFIRS